MDRSTKPFCFHEHNYLKEKPDYASNHFRYGVRDMTPLYWDYLGIIVIILIVCYWVPRNAQYDTPIDGF